MKTDLYAEVTNKLVAKLETGLVPWQRGWNAGTSIPMNAVSNRPYSGINVLLYWLSEAEGWKSPRFLTFKQAKDAGGTVRAGEKSKFHVVFFKQLEVRDKNATADDETRKIPFMRHTAVFNVDQCDNLPDAVRCGPEHGKVNGDTREELADSFIKSTRADFREGFGRPCYIPSRDFITVPAWSDFHSKPEYYGAAFHELTHWTGHKSRLDRDLSGRFGKDQYAAEELVAELGAAFLCAEFCFDNNASCENHAAYLENWLRVLKSDKRAIFTAASKAQKAVDYMRGLALADGEATAPAENDVAIAA